LTFIPTVIVNNWLIQPAYIENNVIEIKSKKEQIMFIEINTNVEMKTVGSKTVINTEDYPELVGKTIEEIRSLPNSTLLDLKKEDDVSAIRNTMRFLVDDIAFMHRTSNDNDFDCLVMTASNKKYR
jgi:hypothetical protein